MNSFLYVITGLVIGAGIGIIIGRYLLKKLFKSQENAAQNKARLILKDAENNAEILKKNKLLEAKERFLQMKAEHEQEVNSKNNALNQRENGIKRKSNHSIHASKMCPARKTSWIMPAKMWSARTR